MLVVPPFGLCVDALRLVSFHHGVKSGPRKDEDRGAVGRTPHSSDCLVGVLFSTVRHGYSSPPPLAGSVTLENAQPVGLYSAKEQSHSRLSPGCDDGFGGGILDLRLAEQCSSFLRELYKVRRIRVLKVCVPTLLLASPSKPL